LQDNNQGKLVESTEHLSQLLTEIEKIMEKVDIVHIEYAQLKMIEKHNSKVDVFGKLMDTRSGLLRKEIRQVFDDGNLNGIEEEGHSEFEEDVLKEDAEDEMEKE